MLPGPWVLPLQRSWALSCCLLLGRRGTKLQCCCSWHSLSPILDRVFWLCLRARAKMLSAGLQQLPIRLGAHRQAARAIAHRVSNQTMAHEGIRSAPALLVPHTLWGGQQRLWGDMKDCSLRRHFLHFWQSWASPLPLLRAMAAVTSETAQMGGEPCLQLSGSLSDLVDSQFSPFRHQHTVAVRDRTLLPGKSQQQRKYRLLVHRQKQQQCSCCCASPACALQGSETERMKRRMQMQSLSHSPCLPSLMTWKTCALPASVSQGTPQKPFGKFLVIHCAKSCGHAVLRKPTRKGTQSIKEKVNDVSSSDHFHFWASSAGSLV